MRASAVAVFVCLLAAGPAMAHEHHGDGKHHLKKANELAEAGKCAAAVKEYTAAYENLHDPIVLFNRAECYRRLGENGKAADDYRGYLKGFPTAPNRAEIEGRIAALERPATPPRPVAASRPPATAPARSPIVQPLAPRAPAKRPVAAAPMVPPPTPTATAPTSPPDTAASAPMPFLPPPPLPGGGDPHALVEAPHAPAKDSAHDEGHGAHWLLWTTLAVVAVGGGVAGYVLLRPKDPGPPPSMYGNYRF